MDGSFVGEIRGGFGRPARFTARVEKGRTVAQTGGRPPCLCPRAVPQPCERSRATERRVPGHWGRLPARRPAAVRTEPPHPRRLGRSHPPL
jgi:hypothetical protein